MNKGGTQSNCFVEIKEKEIIKEYKPGVHNAFVNELFVYLFAKEKNTIYPKLISYDLEKGF